MEYNFSQKYKISFSWALLSVHRFSRQTLKGKEIDEKESRRRLLKWFKSEKPESKVLEADGFS